MARKRLLPLTEIVRQLVEHRNNSTEYSDIGAIDLAIQNLNRHSTLHRTLRERWKGLINSDDEAEAT